MSNALAPQAAIGAARLSDNHAFEPSGRDDRKSSKDRERTVVPSGNGHNQETTNSEQLHRRCHVALNIDAEGRLFQRFKIGETEHKPRGNERRNGCNDDGSRKIVLPQEIEAENSGANIGQKFGRMNLVEEESGHAGSSDFLRGLRRLRLSADGKGLNLGPAPCHESGCYIGHPRKIVANEGAG